MYTNRTHPTHGRTASLLLSVAAVAGLALTASGCGKSPSEFVAEKVIEQQTDGDVDVDFDSGEINIDTPDGQVQMGEDGSFTVTDENGEVLTGQGDDDSFTVEGDDGSFTMSQSGDIPDEWPGDVPQPDGVSISGSSVIDTGEDGNGITLAGTVDDGAAFIADYGASLEAAGLTKASEYSTEEASSAIYGNDAWMMSIGTSEFDGVQQVTITLYPQTD